MINIAEMILMGIWATLVMDIMAIIFGKLRIIHALIKPQVVGRWALYMFRGKFIHENINNTPALGNEKLAALISHYLIGIALAGVYLFMELQEPIIRDQIWMALIFGLITVLLPWLWLYPSIGIGFLASKTPKKSPYIITSLINHTDFGLGMVIWIVVFRRFIT
jgi:hypothetical protein